MKKDISVVIPTWNRPRLLQNCLHALSRQTLDAARFEVIVVSDGPDKATTRFLRQLNTDERKPFRLMSLREKSGPAAARNLGWKNADADLIAFTDDDCIPDPEWLYSMLQAHKGEALAAYSGQLRVPLRRYPTDHEVNTSRLEKATFITANCALTRQALDKIGGFDERYTMAWREDSDLEFSCIRHGIPITRISAARVEHPVRPAPWGYSVKEEKKGMYNALLYRKFPGLYDLRIGARPPVLYYIIISCFAIFLYGFAAQDRTVYSIGFIAWMVLVVAFTVKRLYGKSRRLSHIGEMLISSAAIPFLSVWWHWYGLIKFRKVANYESEI